MFWGLEGLWSVFAQILPGLALGKFSSCLLCPFDIRSSLWDCFLSRHFLTFWHPRCSRLILCISCSRPGISHFSRGSGSFWNGIRNQYLGIACACSCWGVSASRHSQLTEEGNVCILTCVYSHTSVSSCDYLCVY